MTRITPDWDFLDAADMGALGGCTTVESSGVGSVMKTKTEAMHRLVESLKERDRSKDLDRQLDEDLSYADRGSRR